VNPPKLPPLKLVSNWRIKIYPKLAPKRISLRETRKKRRFKIDLPYLGI